MKVSDSGGQPAQLTSPNDPNLSHRWPQFLPDGDHILFLSIKEGGTVDELDAVSISGGEVRKVADDHGNLSIYHQGRLLWVRGADLLAQNFDASTLKLSGTQRVLAENLAVDQSRWTSDVTVSATDLLVYRSSANSDRTQLTWLDLETANAIGSIGEPGPYQNPVVSPDGRKIAVSTSNQQDESSSIVLMDAGRGVATLFVPTSEKSGFNGYIWTPDSKNLVFGSNRGSLQRYSLYIKPVSGEPEQLLLKSDEDLFPSAVTPDGKYIVFGKYGSGESSDDVWMMPLQGERKPVPLLTTKAKEYGLEVSPDGRWLAYRSDESERYEVYLTSFPSCKGKWQVSGNGGNGISFRHDGREIAYVDDEGKVYALEFDGRGTEPKMGKQRPVMTGISMTSLAGGSVSPDWKHLVGAVRIQTGPPRLTLVTHWSEELKK